MPQYMLEVRFPNTASASSAIDSVLDEYTERLTEPGEFHDGEEEEDGEICFYLYGPDPKRLRDIARATLADLEVLSGAYMIEVGPGQEGTERGARLPF